MTYFFRLIIFFILEGVLLKFLQASWSKRLVYDLSLNREVIKMELIVLVLVIALVLCGYSLVVDYLRHWKGK